jgi:hypothetical protein
MSIRGDSPSALVNVQPKFRKRRWFLVAGRVP